MGVAAVRLLRYPRRNHTHHMALIRLAFWGSLFVLSTFAFTVLFEHGPMNYFDNAKKEKETLMGMMGKKVERKGDASDKLTPPLH